MLIITPNPSLPLIPDERIASMVFLIRGVKVMLDSDLAELYGVPTGRLNEAVKRNISRFPEDFAFQLSRQESDTLISQIAISNLRCQIGTLKTACRFDLQTT